ncbi:MAG: hypothetical protein JW700_01890 [Candidatus Aenigmarchaeota archaeon]|nr:hypothetical protein [Candidatus Aenigmarchaeota archaeon]
MDYCCSEKLWSEVKRTAESIAIPKYTLNVPIPENRIVHIEYPREQSNEIISEMDNALIKFKALGLIEIETKRHFFDVKSEIMEIFRN